MTFEGFQETVKRAVRENQRWRVGQAAFNVLCEHRPDLSEQIRGRALDPFHDNTLLPEFYAWVKRNWNPEDQP